MVGAAALHSDALSQAPICDAARPVIIEYRDGAHSGEWQYAASNRAPRSASESIDGVCTTGWP